MHPCLLQKHEASGNEIKSLYCLGNVAELFVYHASNNGSQRSRHSKGLICALGAHVHPLSWGLRILRRTALPVWNTGTTCAEPVFLALDHRVYCGAVDPDGPLRLCCYVGTGQAAEHVHIQTADPPPSIREKLAFRAPPRWQGQGPRPTWQGRLRQTLCSPDSYLAPGCTSVGVVPRRFASRECLGGDGHRNML